MDAVNRRLAMAFLLEFAHRNPERQIILLTPGDVSGALRACMPMWCMYVCSCVRAHVTSACWQCSMAAVAAAAAAFHRSECWTWPISGCSMLL
jgi:hypothetical protein